MPQENSVGGLFDSWTKIGVDYKGLFADPAFRATLQTQAALMAKYTTSPMNIDDPLIANFEKQLEVWLDSFKSVNTPDHPLVIKAMAPSPAQIVNAKSYLSNLASQEHIVFSQLTVDKVTAHPEVIKLISGRERDQQAKILDSAWLDKIIGWVVKYGPLIAQILMFLVPLL
jgi:hypothetical protein